MRGGLICQRIEAGYDLAPVLHGVDLDLAEGQFAALVGLNGSGKTTLFKAIFGQLALREGEIWWDGARIDRMRSWDRVKRGIAHVPQGRHLFAEMTTNDNLMLGALPIRRDSRAVEQRRDEVLTIFPRLRERLNQVAGTMSGGEQQMLAIARGLMSCPRLMLLDEVSLGLSPKMAQEVADALRTIRDLGIGILMIEHRPWLLEGNAEVVHFLDRGTISWSGSLAEALASGRIQDFYLSGSATDR